MDHHVLSTYQGWSNVEDRVEPFTPIVVSVPGKPTSQHWRAWSQTALNLGQRTFTTEDIDIEYQWCRVQ